MPEPKGAAGLGRRPGEVGEAVIAHHPPALDLLIVEPGDRSGLKPITVASAHRAAVENLLKQEFASPDPNRCWAGDITYIRTSAGWRYLALWIDLFSRRVVGWKLDNVWMPLL